MTRTTTSTSTRKRSLLILVLVCAATACGCQKLAFWRKDSKRDVAAKQTPSWLGGAQLAPTKAQKTDFMLEMAGMFESQGETEQAIHAYEAVLQQKEAPLAMHRLGVLCVKQGDIDRAVAYFQRAVECGGENAELLCDLGYGLYLGQRYAEADAALRQAIVLDPQLARAHVNYGMLLARTGRADDALWAFSRAGLSESEARNNLAFAMLVDKRFPEAQAQYEGALRADPQNEPARRGLATLNQVQHRGVAGPQQGVTAVAQRPATSAAPVSYSAR
ncbi:MAG: tetratricopeptide repeat protein [Pirellulaceae bacterium]